jgi:hypothetical protein
MKETLLTAPLSAEQQALRNKAEDLLGKAETVALSIWLDEYKVGGISLESMCEKVRSALIRIGVPEGVRLRIIGQTVDEALASPKPRRKRGKVGHPISLQKTTAKLVDLVVDREGLSKSRDSGDRATAFQRVSEILDLVGFEVSAESVIRYYFEYKDAIG